MHSGMLWKQYWGPIFIGHLSTIYPFKTNDSFWHSLSLSIKLISISSVKSHHLSRHVCVCDTSNSCAVTSTHVYSEVSPGTPVEFPVPRLCLSNAIAPNTAGTETTKPYCMLRGKEYIHTVCGVYVRVWSCRILMLRIQVPRMPNAQMLPQALPAGKWCHPVQCAAQTVYAASCASPDRSPIQSHSNTRSRTGWMQRYTWNTHTNTSEILTTFVRL